MLTRLLGGVYHAERGEKMIKVEKVNIWGRVTKCAHRCRYCLQGEQSQPLLNWDTYVKTVERYVRWGNENDMRIGFELAGNFDLTLEQYKKYLELSSLSGKFSDSLLMGGMRMRTEDEMRIWLAERQEMGLKKVIFSMGGTEQHHDAMNRRKGDFQYLLGAQRAAFILGLSVEQRIFITKENMQSMDGLCRVLDDIGVPFRRSIYPLHFRGNAMDMENVRLDENDVKCIPENVMRYMMPDMLLSERQWASQLCGSTEQNPEKIGFFLYMDTKNTEKLLSGDCKEIIESAGKEVAEEYAKMPTLAELCRKYADTSCRKIHEGKSKVYALWFERYIADTENGVTPQKAAVLHSIFPAKKSVIHKI